MKEKCSYTTAVQSTGVLQLQALECFESCPWFSFASVLPSYHLTPQYSSCASPKASFCCFINRKLAALLNMENNVISIVSGWSKENVLELLFSWLQTFCLMFMNFEAPLWPPLRNKIKPHTSTSPLALRTLSLHMTLYLFIGKYLAQFCELYIFLTSKSFSAKAAIQTQGHQGSVAFWHCLAFWPFGKGKSSY